MCIVAHEFNFLQSANQCFDVCRPADTRLSDDEKKLGDGDDFANTRGQEGSNLHSNAESQHGSGERRIDL